MNLLKFSALLSAVLLLAACGSEPAPAPDSAPSVAPPAAAASAEPAPWAFTDGAVFPADRSLLRPEDGEALADGRLLVADQIHGLRLLAADGSSRPFGRFADAGYRHEPPTAEGGPNGVSLEPDGQHLLVADVFSGAIYRVSIADEATEKVYQHPFGVNTAVADRAGGIWFTQSTQNQPSDGEVGLFSAVNTPVPNGALLYLPPAGADGSRTPITAVDGLLFANGIALDERTRVIYVAETMGNRVLRFTITADGSLTDRQVIAEPMGPDNLELGPDGQLWVALPVSSELVVVDLASRQSRIAYRIRTPESAAALETIAGRMAAGQGWLDLIAPALWTPAPGLMTGVILSPEGKPLFWTGLGDAIIRL